MAGQIIYFLRKYEGKAFFRIGCLASSETVGSRFIFGRRGSFPLLFFFLSPSDTVGEAKIAENGRSSSICGLSGRSLKTRLLQINMYICIFHIYVYMHVQAKMHACQRKWYISIYCSSISPHTEPRCFSPRHWCFPSPYPPLAVPFVRGKWGKFKLDMLVHLCIRIEGFIRDMVLTKELKKMSFLSKHYFFQFFIDIIYKKVFSIRQLY